MKGFWESLSFQKPKKKVPRGAFSNFLPLLNGDVTPGLTGLPVTRREHRMWTIKEGGTTQ